MLTETQLLEQGEESSVRVEPELRTVGLCGQFEDVDSVVAAARSFRQAGYKFFDVHSPFPIHGIDHVMGIKSTILPWLVAIGGVSGCTLGVIMTWFINAGEMPQIWQQLSGYQFLISGKPLWSLPAYIPVIFECTVLASALTTVFGLFLLNKLPMLYNPLFKLEKFRKVTDDKFFVVVDAGDAMYDQDKAVEMLKAAGASSIETVEDN